MIMNTGGGALDTYGNNMTLSGGISGVGGLTKIGEGILNIDGVTSYVGATLIQSGTLALIGLSDLSMSSDMIVSGTFDISGVTSDAVDIMKLSGSGLVERVSKTLSLTDTDSVFSGVITGMAH